MDELPKEFEFFASLVEQYAASRGTTADKVLAALDAKGKTDFVYGMYDRYHVEAMENAFNDIDRLLGDRPS